MESLKRYYESLAAGLGTCLDKISKVCKRLMIGCWNRPKRIEPEGKVAEKTLMYELASAKKEIARLAAEKDAVAKEFAERLEAAQAEVYRITGEKAISEMSLKAQLQKVRTDLEGRAAESPPPAIVPTEEQEPAKARALLPRSATRKPTRLVMGLVCCELAVVAIGVLVYVIAAPNRPLNVQALKSGGTPKAAPSRADASKIVVTPPVDGKSAPADSSLGKSPAAVPAVAETRPRSHPNKKVHTASAKMKRKMKPATATRAHASPAPLADEGDEEAEYPENSYWQRYFETQPPTEPEHATGAGSQTPQKKYRVDMYPFARY